MYSNIMMLLILILPIPMLVNGLKRGENPYRVVLKGAVLSGVGIAFIFIAAQLAGNGVGKEIDRVIDQVSRMLAGNDQMAQMMGLESDSRTERIAAYKKIYSAGADILPAVMLITAVIVSYIEGLIIGRLIKVNGRPLNPVPPIREFTLPRNTIMGWMLIFIASWILKAVGFSGGRMILANVNLLFEFTFALQGMALIFLFAYKKKIPKIVPVIAVIILWFTSIGQTIMFFAGILDLLLSLRARISGKN